MKKQRLEPTVKEKQDLLRDVSKQLAEGKKVAQDKMDAARKYWSQLTPKQQVQLANYVKSGIQLLLMAAE